MDIVELESVEERWNRLVLQLTTFRISYAQELLHDKGLAYSGSVAKVRERLHDALQSGVVTDDDILGLLAPLETWGKQCIRCVTMPLHLLAELQTAEQVRAKAASIGWEPLINRELPLDPGRDLEVHSVRFKEAGGRRTLTLLGAKMRVFERAVNNIDPIHDEQDPNILYKPYRIERQKSLTFAEIDLQTGETLLSTRKSGYGMKHETEFQEFTLLANPFVHLGSSQRTDFCLACNRIPNETGLDETCLPHHALSDDQGGELGAKSSGKRVDFRTHPNLQQAFATLGNDAPGNFCNAFWLVRDGLVEEVHASIWGTLGEVVIHTQASEESIRHVLQRVRSLN